MSKRTIFITYQEQTHRLAWFPGTSDDTIRDTIKEILGLPAEVGIVLKDDSNITYAANQHLPNDLSVRIEVRSRDNFYLDDHIARKSDSGNSNSKQTVTQDSSEDSIANEDRRQYSNKYISSPNNSASVEFRGELLKFERINAHLANERTWLAWVRTALSALSCAFAFLSLSSSSSSMEVFVYILGSLFCLCVLLIYYTGWLRYGRVKMILGLSFKDITNEFNRIGIHWVASAMGLLFLSTTVMYWIGVFQDMK